MLAARKRQFQLKFKYNENELAWLGLLVVVRFMCECNVNNETVETGKRKKEKCGRNMRRVRIKEKRKTPFSTHT